MNQIIATCGCCLSTGIKAIKSISQGKYENGLELQIIFICPECKKASTVSYKEYSFGPLNSENGYQLKRGNNNV